MFNSKCKRASFLRKALFTFMGISLFTLPLSFAGMASVASGSEELTLNERLKDLRDEKYEKYPQLTMDFIEELITLETVISREEFLALPQVGLAECIQRAMQVAPKALHAQKRLKLAKMQLLSSFRNFFPDFTVDVEYQEGALSGQAFTGDQYHIRIVQPIFKGGKLVNNLKEQKEAMKSTEAEIRVIEDELIEKVAQAYFEQDRALRSFQQMESLKRVADHILSQTERKHEAGLISEIEYLNVSSTFSQIMHDLEEASQERDLTELELQSVLGMDTLKNIELVSYYQDEEVIGMFRDTQDFTTMLIDTLQPMNTIESIDHYVKLAYDNKPDFKENLYHVRSTIFALKAARGDLFPQVDLTMEFGEIAESFKEDIARPPHIPEWQAIVEVTWNIGGSTITYNLNRDQNAPSISQFLSGAGTDTQTNSFTFSLLDDLDKLSERRAAEMELMQQYVQLEEVEREMVHDVKEAYYNLKRASVQLESGIKQLLYRERLIRLSKHKLETLETEASEYLQSEIDLAEERKRFYKAMSDFFIARAAMNRATGLRDLFIIDKLKGLNPNGTE